MPSLDQIFAREFKDMAQQRKAMTGAFTLDALAVPKFGVGVDKKRRVLLMGINDEYYGKLNNEEVIYWARPNLKRRKFGAGGAFLKDNTGKIIVEDVPLTQGCIAVISKTRIGVPLKYKPREDFQYVDCYCRNNECSYIYIIPKKYCYALNQCALVVSLTRLRSFYAGCSVVLCSGHTVYVYVIPYNPLRETYNYRVLASKTSCNFQKEINQLLNFWVMNNMAFQVADTALSEPVNGSYNVAYNEFSTNLSEFMRFDPNRSLAVNTDDISDSDIL